MKNTTKQRLGAKAGMIAILVLSSFFVLTAVSAEETTPVPPVESIQPTAPPPAPAPATCSQCQQAKADGGCEFLSLGAKDPTGGCGDQVCDGRGGCATIKDPALLAPQPAESGQAGGEGQMFMPQKEGPSEEEMNQRRLEQMKKGFKRFNQEIARVKKQVRNYEKKGVIIPKEMTEAMAKVDEIIPQIESAQSPDELEDIINTLEDSLQTIRENLNQLPRLAQFPRLLKQAKKDLVKLEKTYNTDKRKAEKSKMDLTDILNDFTNTLNQQKSLLAEIEELAKTDMIEAFDKLTEDFFGNMGDVWENDRIIQMALNLKNGIKQMTRELKEAERMVKNFKRKKIDTGELEAILAASKTKFEEVKRLAAAKPLDVDAVIDAIDEMMADKQDFNDNLRELTGENTYLPSMPQAKGIDLKLPDGYITPDKPAGPINQGPETTGGQTCNINGVEVPGKCSELQGGAGQILGVEYIEYKNGDLLRNAKTSQIYRLTLNQKELIENMTELWIKYLGQPIYNVGEQILALFPDKK